MTTNKNEIWKDIEGFDGFYQVSDQGRVRSFRIPGHFGHRSAQPKIITPQLVPKNQRGYLKLRLDWPIGSYKRVNVNLAAAILTAFVGPRPHKYDSSHINGNRLDNRLQNLKWETRRENCLRKFAHGTMHLAKMDEKTIINIRKDFRDGMKPKHIALKYKSKIYNIYVVLRNRTWKHLVLDKKN